jgi:hypothetical protein
MLRTLPVMKSLALMFETRGIPYMIFGGRAAKEYGLSRPTPDVDVSVGLEPMDMGYLRHLVEGLGWRIIPREIWMVKGRAPVVWAYDPVSGVKADLFLTFMRFQRVAVARARRVDVGPVPVRFATVEDVIVLKVRGWRPQDIADVRELLARAQSLDRAYIRYWLGEVGRELSQPLLKRWASLQD